MIFRLSQKLSTKIKAGTLRAAAPDENPTADWSAHLFSADRAQYILVCNTRSLYSTVLYAKGVTNDNVFITRVLAGLREFMEDDGLEPIYTHQIAPAAASVRFAKALDRSVTGSMNDLVYHATMHLTEDGMAPYDVGFKLNEIPFSSLKYANPREALKAMAVGPSIGLVLPVDTLPRNEPAKATSSAKPKSILGHWRITQMDMWDQDFVDAEVEGYIRLDEAGSGEFQFGYVHGLIDYELGKRDGRPAAEWSWEGNDEMDPASGRGWAVLQNDGTIKGKLSFHRGDKSGFAAIRKAVPVKRPANE